MAHNPFIFKQFIKTFITSIEFFESTFGIAEMIIKNPKYIEKTDMLKQKIEDKTGIHIYRHNEKEYEKCLSCDDPRIIEIIEEFGITDQSAKERLAEDMKVNRMEKIKENVLAVLFCIAIWSFIFRMIFKLFQY